MRWARRLVRLDPSEERPSGLRGDRRFVTSVYTVGGKDNVGRVVAVLVVEPCRNGRERWSTKRPAIGDPTRDRSYDGADVDVTKFGTFDEACLWGGRLSRVQSACGLAGKVFPHRSCALADGAFLSVVFLSKFLSKKQPVELMVEAYNEHLLLASA